MVMGIRTYNKLRENDGQIMNTHNSPTRYWAPPGILHFIRTFKVGSRVASGKWCTFIGGGGAAPGAVGV